MQQRGRRRVLLAIAAIATLVVGALVGLGAVRGAGRADAPVTVTVLTRNLYLGGDVTRPVRAAAAGATGREALGALAGATAELRGVVDRTDWPGRSALLAAEIADARPDVVGLQEVARWRRGPLQLDAVGRLDATEVELNFLPTLLADLAARGVPYEVAAAADASDVEAPAFTGDPTARTARDVRLSVQDVLLVRADSAVRVTGAGGGRFTARLDLDLAGVPFSFVRGYAFADLTVDGRPLRVVSTQLESQSDDVARTQADELVAGPAAAGPRPVVLLCDCNSEPGTAAYGRLTGSGLVDAWTAPPDPPGAEGTCCLDERLRATTATYDRRLDLVLSRGDAAASVTAVRAARTGTEPATGDPSGVRWASDHAGVLAELVLAPA